MTTDNNNDGGLVLQQSEGRSLPESSGGGGGHVVEGNNGLRKGPWTAAEDQILMEYVRKHSEGNWNSVQKNSGLNRCGKSCRLRWANHLRPNLKKGAFSPGEERLILELHAKYGNKWARMASHLPGRTDNEIKNYWNTRIKKRQRQGLPLYPHDINQAQQSHSQSLSHSLSLSQPTTLTIPTELIPPITAIQSPFQDPANGTIPTFCFQIQSPTQAHNVPQLSSTPPSLSPLSSPHQPKPTTLTSLPLFDPTTTSSFSSSTPSFTFHRPAPILEVPLRYKRYRDSLGFSPPISPNLQRNTSIFRTSSMPDIASFQLTDTNSMPDIASRQFSRVFSFNPSFPPLPQSQFEYSNSLLSPTSSVYSVKSELPSNQVPDTPFEITIDTNSSSASTHNLLSPNDSIYSVKSELPSNHVSRTQSEITIDTNVSSAAANSLLSPTGSVYFVESELLSNYVFQTQSQSTIDTNVSSAAANNLLSPTSSVYSAMSELPSNHVSHTQSEITIDTSESSEVATLAASNETHSSNGLLDDLLQEAEALASVGGNNSSSATGLLGSFEEKHVFDGSCQWLQSTSSMESSLLEARPVQGDPLNSMPEDLSELLNYIPSTEPVSDYNDSGDQLFNCHSSGVTDANLDFDMHLSFLMDRSRVLVIQYS